MLINFALMYLVTRHIEYLLRHHSCVVLPGLGALLVQWLPAVMSPVLGQVTPPRRTMVFNPSIRHDDGLIAASISRLEGLSHQEAVAKVKADVEAMHQALRQDGSVSLGRIGHLTRQGSAMIFTVSPWAERCADTFGLQPVKAAPVRGNEVQEFVTGRSGRWMRPLRVAAMIAVLIVLGAVLSTPIQAPEGLHKATISLTAKGPRLAEVPSAPARLILAALPEVEVTCIDTAARAAYQRRMKAQPPTTSSAGPYTLVVASLDTQAKAERYVAEHPGCRLSIWAYGDNYRVTAGRAASAQQLQGRATQWPGAWVAYRGRL